MSDSRMPWRTWILVGIGLTLALVLCSGCIRRGRVTPPPPPCPINSMLLETADLRDDSWLEVGSRSSKGAPARVGVEKTGTFFAASHGGLVQQVYRLWDERQARNEYRTTTSAWFSSSAGETEWVLPADLAQLSVSAQQYRLACNTIISSGLDHCLYIARYGTYVLHLDVATPAVPHDELIRLIGEVDRRATACLARSQTSNLTASKCDP